MTAPLPPIRDTIRFQINGRPVEAAIPGGARLLDVLRVDLGLTGTKEGCGEGECGACAVLLDGELVNSCLVPLGQVHGHHVVTVEGLATDGRLAPIQQAFLELGGAQCGMCTPGMLLAGSALLASGRPAGEPEIREAIAGNLCRCTGYTKIIEAIGAAGPMCADAIGAGGASAVVAGPNPAPVALLVGSSAPARRVIRPGSLPDALARLAAQPDLRPIAGCTDVMVEPGTGVASGPPRGPLLDLWDLDELRGIEIVRDELVLGALTTWTDLRRSPVVRGALPVLGEVAASVGAVAIRNRGTIGGNCVTASPAGDLLPVLLATDALIEVAGPLGTRSIPAAAFWTGYRRTGLAAGELLVAVRIPLVPGRRVRFRKLGTRRALAIAKVVMAVAWQDEAAIRGDDGRTGPGAWHDVRVAIGSVAERPIRARRTEAVLEGRVPDASTAAEAAATIQAEITPIDDIRSTAAYRRAVSGRIMRRLVLDAAAD
jgi:carbon-monoxide dehydrogenase small subunit/xanthine dehydrogenase small subunit